jgi:hypothetical protein
MIDLEKFRAELEVYVEGLRKAIVEGFEYRNQRAVIPRRGAIARGICCAAVSKSRFLGR